MQVSKRDNSLEDFSLDKVYQSLINCGLDEVNANKIASQIETWVQQSEMPVPTALIRKKVIGLMETVDQQAAENYKSYQEPE